MRSIHKLLKLLLEDLLNGGLMTGMCREIRVMLNSKIITLREYIILLNYLHEHAPKRIGGLAGTCQYWYDPGVKTYRIIWLKRHIKLTK